MVSLLSRSSSSLKRRRFSSVPSSECPSGVAIDRAFTLAPSGNSPMSSPAYRTKATATSGPIVFTAVNTGPGGNSIALVFDGVDDVIMVEDAWNTANTTNMVSYTGPGDTVIAASTITLSGGADNTQPPAAFTAPSVIA